MATIFQILSALKGGEQPTQISNEPVISEQVNSSVIDTIEYNPAIEVVDVVFNSGAEYQYFNVRQSIAEAWINSASPGTFLNKIIKSGFFPYVRRR
jgi:hypothetical protein